MEGRDGQNGWEVSHWDILIFNLFWMSFFKKDNLFKSKFLTKLRGRLRDFPYIPYPYAYVASPIINLTHQNGAFVFNQGWT